MKNIWRLIVELCAGSVTAFGAGFVFWHALQIGKWPESFRTPWLWAVICLALPFGGVLGLGAARLLRRPTWKRELLGATTALVATPLAMDLVLWRLPQWGINVYWFMRGWPEGYGFLADMILFPVLATVLAMVAWHGVLLTWKGRARQSGVVASALHS
jgi:hypothetical protein